MAENDISEIGPQGGPKSHLVRGVVDYGGLVVFLLTYLAAKFILKQPGTQPLLTATWGLVVGSAVALLTGLVVEKRIAPLPLFAGLAALIFGGLTLVFHDPRFVKIKPTAINIALAGVMLIGTALGKNPLKALFSDALHLTPQGWRTLTIRYGIFFLVMAGANEAVWRTQPDSVWILFRFPGLQVLSLLFALTQVPMMMRDMKAIEAAAEMEP
ncbi:MAG TPA: inner membrane-spanning protein YciB [Caulobacteraceae bacterium]